MPEIQSATKNWNNPNFMFYHSGGFAVFIPLASKCAFLIQTMSPFFAIAIFLWSKINLVNYAMTNFFKFI